MRDWKAVILLWALYEEVKECSVQIPLLIRIKAPIISGKRGILFHKGVCFFGDQTKNSAVWPRSFNFSADIEPSNFHLFRPLHESINFKKLYGKLQKVPGGVLCTES